MAYYKKLRDLREDADKTQRDVAIYLDTTAQYYGKYEKGEIELPFVRAIELADFYGVSLDYIADRFSYTNDTSITKEEQNLLFKWRYLSERDKGKVEFLIDDLFEKRNK